MTEHVREYLGAYLDGELHGWRLQQVESHLKDCRVCLDELNELRSLSALLRETPLEERLIPLERFVAQVALRLPRQQETAPGWRALNAGWWFAPACLVGAWAFAQTVIIVSWLVWTAGQMGMLGLAGTWLQDVPRSNLWLHTTLSLFNGNLIDLKPALHLAESWGQALLSQAMWIFVIASLYWTWLVAWGLRRRQFGMQKI